jgi:hypothetical protein
MIYNVLCVYHSFSISLQKFSSISFPISYILNNLLQLIIHTLKFLQIYNDVNDLLADMRKNLKN